MDPEQLYIFLSTNKYFFTLYIMVQSLWQIYKSDDRKKYIDDGGSGIFPKKKVG